MSEDDWTERLCIGLRGGYHSHKVCFTAKIRDFRALQMKVSGIYEVDIYPFYGSPDVMIYDKQTSLGDTVAGVVVGGGSKEKEGGGGGGESPKLIEAAFQKPLVPITPLLCLLNWVS